MPAPGDQHTPWANPFEEPKHKGLDWTQEEIAIISSKLDKQLGPEYISSRSGPGGSRVHYLTAEKVITLANEVFGFNGWSSSIQNIQVDFADENPQTQRVSIGLSVIVRVTLRNGTYHEDIGYGSIENAKGKAMAFEKAKKEGTTDGLKRALRSFGSVLGNCIYDQDYVKQVTKIKVQPAKKFDEDNLHRHAGFAKKEVARPEAARPEPVANVVNMTNMTTSTSVPKLDPEDSFDDFFGELDGADFCVPGEGHPDEIVLSNNPPNMQQAMSRPLQSVPQPNKPNTGNNDYRPPQTPNQGQKRPLPPPQNNAHGMPPGRPIPAPGLAAAAAGAAKPGPPSNMASNAQPPMAMPNPGESVGFFSAKAVSQLPSSSLQNSPLAMPRGHQAFNPKAESPSIRKTPGIDHSSSKPLARNGQHVAPSASQATTAGAATAEPKTSSFAPVRPLPNAAAGPARGTIYPPLDQTRRIGAPGAPGSPLANRNSYRPPTMKRPLPGEAGGASAGQQRAPLQELSANEAASTDAAMTDGLEAKRLKVT